MTELEEEALSILGDTFAEWKTFRDDGRMRFFESADKDKHHKMKMEISDINDGFNELKDISQQLLRLQGRVDSYRKRVVSAVKRKGAFVFIYVPL
jgi:hypothetical protein